MWTAEQARLMSRRGAEASRQARLLNPPKPKPTLSREPSDVFARRLMRAQKEKLDELLSCDDAKACASLAQAIRHLRETYHMVTGLAKPGVTRPTSARAPRKAYAQQPMPSGWESTPDASKQAQPAPQTPAQPQANTTPKESS